MKPLLLVDIDGVLNCFGRIWTEASDDRSDDRWEVPPFESHGRGLGVTLHIPKGTGARLAVLAERFRMVWGTAWMHDAHPSLSHLWPVGDPCEACDGGRMDDGRMEALCEACAGTSLQSWPVIDFTSGWVEEGKTWKLPSVQAFVGDEPFAWIDDDLQKDAFVWTADRTDRQGIPSKLVRTRPSTGMTDEHVEELVAFADFVTEAAKTSGQRWATT